MPSRWKLAHAGARIMATEISLAALVLMSFVVWWRGSIVGYFKSPLAAEIFGLETNETPEMVNGDNGVGAQNNKHENRHAGRRRQGNFHTITARYYGAFLKFARIRHFDGISCEYSGVDDGHVAAGSDEHDERRASVPR